MHVFKFMYVFIFVSMNSYTFARICRYAYVNCIWVTHMQVSVFVSMYTYTYACICRYAYINYIWVTKYLSKFSILTYATINIVKENLKNIEIKGNSITSAIMMKYTCRVPSTLILKGVTSSPAVSALLNF